MLSDTSLLVSRPRDSVIIWTCDRVVDLSPLSKIKKVELVDMHGI